MASLTGLYTSGPTDYENNGYSPRRSYGRNGGPRPPISPTMSVTDSPTGETTRYSNIPYSPAPAPQVDRETMFRQMNAGTVPRGMSPDAANIRALNGPNQSVARGAPLMPSSQYSPQAAPAPLGPQSGQTAQPATPAGISPQRRKQLDNEYATNSRYSRDHIANGGKDTDEIYKGWQTRNQRIRAGQDPDAPETPTPANFGKRMVGQMESGFQGGVPTSGGYPTVGTNPNGGPQMMNTAPTPQFRNPQTGAPQMLPPITPEVRAQNEEKYQKLQKDPAYQAKKADLYQQVVDGLSKNPSLGTQPLPAWQRVPGAATPDPNGKVNQDIPYQTMTPTQAAQAVQAGPEQTARNRAATQNQVNAGRQKIEDSNASQMQFNQTAMSAAQLRLKQFAGGNFDTSQPLKLDDIKDMTEKRQAYESAPNGFPFVHDGQVYLKGQQGPVKNDPVPAPVPGKSQRLQEPYSGA